MQAAASSTAAATVRLRAPSPPVGRGEAGGSGGGGRGEPRPRTGAASFLRALHRVPTAHRRKGQVDVRPPGGPQRVNTRFSRGGGGPDPPRLSHPFDSEIVH